MTAMVNASRQMTLFLGIAASSVAISTAISLGLFQILGTPVSSDRLHFPPALAFSTAFLFTGGFALHRAAYYVRREKQAAFRRWLWIGLGCGVLFIGVQCYALRGLVPVTRSGEQSSRGMTSFVLVFAGLHAMHFFVALLFVSFVAARTIADRYDHEYHWGVTFCAWFWHALGMVWLAILAIFAIVL